MSIDFILKLHKKMFDQTWKWAGKFRQKETQPGIDPKQIPEQTKLLLDDVLCWIKYNTYDQQEIAYRFHHRLVQIHPFLNGNGRHSREITDILLRILGLEQFSWGRHIDLMQESKIRKKYIQALRTADTGNYALLRQFLELE